MKTFSPLLLTLSVCAAALQPTAALAWGPQGHRLVARVAETELTPQARAQVSQLLAGEADPSLAGVATWADELRANDPDLGKRSGPGITSISANTTAAMYRRAIARMATA